MTLRDRILDCLSTADRPLTQIEIAQRLDAVPSSVRRTVQTMERTKAIIYREMVGANSPTFSLPPAVVAPATVTNQGDGASV